MKRYLPLGPPQYADIESDYRATLVYTLSWAWIIGITILGGLEILVTPVFWQHEAAIIIAINAVAFICLLLNRNKHTKEASVVLPVALWLIMSTRAFISGGIYASAIVAYLPIIITSGFLLGAWQGAAMAVLCFFSTLVFVLLDIYGDLPAKWVVHTPVTTWICYTLSCLQITVMQFWVAGRIRKSFQTIALETDERKHAELRLKESEFNYRMIAENKILGVGWISPEGKLIRASETMRTMLGYDPGELNGTFFGDFTHPDDLQAELPLFDKISKKEIGYYVIEKRFRHKSGDYFWVQLSRTAYYNASGNIEFYISIIQNIQQKKLAEEALKESEERYRVMVENAVEAVVVLDIEKGTFVLFSHSALQFFKLSEEELLKKGPADVSPKYQPNGRLSSEMAAENLSKAINGDKPVFEWTHCDSKGKPLLTEVRLVRLPAANSALVRGSLIDISERKKKEEELRETNERLHQLSAYLQTVREEERTRIAREIHDELGQQLTGLKMDASALIKEIADDNQSGRHKIEAMLGIIDDTINTVNKISSDLRPSLLDNLGLQAAIEWQSSEFEKRSGIKCNLHIYGSESAVDKDVSTCVFRIYQEALTNIIRHAHATRVDTTLEINEDYINLKVKDNGFGFDENERTNRSTFGLTGMEERARMFNGQLEIESTPRKGTTITLNIPKSARILNTHV